MAFAKLAIIGSALALAFSAQASQTKWQDDSLVAGPKAIAQVQSCGYWPAWHSFKTQFVTAQGRVVDHSDPRQITTSEGQAYALFFALVANDRNSFDLLLKWTEKQLAEGDLSARLPAWLWGEKAPNQYAILDSNPASDADIWLAYTLAEAAKLWNDRRYAVLSAVLAKRIIREQTLPAEGLGLTLLPAPRGFERPDNGQLKLNPSYAPLQLFSRLAELYPHSPWQQLAEGSLQMLLQSAPKGLAPDWVNYLPSKGFNFDKDSASTGSFNAIRVYLWAGLMANSDSRKATLIQHFKPMLAATDKNQGVPLEVDAQTGKYQKLGPIGFTAALLPMAMAATDSFSVLYRNLQNRLAQTDPVSYQDRYYDSVLTLFAAGWIEQRYQFMDNGALNAAWSNQCQ